jgi:DNA-binding NtrC family response regulator
MAWRIIVMEHAGWPLDCADLLAGCEFERLEWRSIAPQRLHECLGDLLVASALGDTTEPIASFRWLLANAVMMPVLAILPEQADDELVRITAQMAADFAVWPARREEIRHRVTRILGETPSEVEAIGRRLSDEAGLRQLVGRDPAFLHIIAQIPLVARSNRPVLITGETGTGKELCARAIHHLGRRRNFPFIAVDCGAFPDSLFDNELFGHNRGAFTDAYREQKGLVAMAEGGTLFLDEIDSLSPSSQAKLLRFLQERTYRPLGSDRFVHADVNILTATNRELDDLVREKRFRSDLFFRLSVLRVHMVPLRERVDDIPILARHFLDYLCAEEGRPRKMLAPATLVALQHTEWPGNVRELYNVVQRAFVFADGGQVLPAHLAAARTGPTEPAVQDPGGFRAARARAIEAFERQYVSETLRAHNGNITQAARWAGQDRRAFGRLIKRHKIDRRAI